MGDSEGESGIQSLPGLNSELNSKDTWKPVSKKWSFAFADHFAKSCIMCYLQHKSYKIKRTRVLCNTPNLQWNCRLSHSYEEIREINKSSSIYFTFNMLVIIKSSWKKIWEITF